jgi:hypothetical protein
MLATLPIEWTDLFATKTPPDSTLELRAVKKSGRAFLLVPLSPSLAARALSLYPAQTRFARLAKSSLRAAFQIGLPLGLEKNSTKFSSRDPFPCFLAGLASSQTGPLPPLAILSGNAGTAGRRFVIVLFNEKNRPAFVVKAGLGDAARQLIRHEAAFLHSAPPGTPGLPQLRASFDTGAISAFALDFMDGNSPAPDAWPAFGELLASWVDREKQIPLREIPAWRSLEKAAAADPVFARLSPKLAGLTVHPAIYHGDFAPWNIKLSPRAIMYSVLDWERGELTGIPGWDWFHYVIQSGILVQKLAPEPLAQRIEQLFAAPAFRDYARVGGISGQERLLVIGYLGHLVNVIRPSEGFETNQSLLALLAQRWLM